ncbi:strigolactone esterase D14-like [Zingiber officinale]|uniref:strigolactone esterase D14-like n=1 Tax=Zingiber officinale TaxID=94328 RepID=UPI001C4ADD40|nr:strigolactone esterase D14-like [Zingiber officinale]
MKMVDLIANVRLIGEGEPTVVLAHGYGIDQSTWDLLLPHLSRSHRLLLFDWNFAGAGSGIADADEHGIVDTDEGGLDLSSWSSLSALAEAVVALMERLQVRGAILVGHSMSAMIGCIASTRNPRLFSHLVLLSASPRYLNSGDGYEGGFEMTNVEQLLSNIKSDFHSWIDNFIPLAVGITGAAATMVDKFKASFRSMKPAIAYTVARAVFLCDLRDIVDEVETPTTIIQTSNDFVVPVAVGRYLQRRINKGQATLEIIDGDGHFPQLVAVPELLQILDRVLQHVV